MTARILVVDDEAALTHILGLVLRKRGYEVLVCGTGQCAVAAYQKAPVDVVLLDYALPDMTGTEVFERLRRLDPRVICIYMTAFGSIRSAVDAIKGGALDYFAKPFDNDELLAAVDRGVKLRRLSVEMQWREDRGSVLDGADGLVTASPAMRAVGEALGKIAEIDATVLIRGESGTGKEVIARAIHRRSVRAAGPFVAVNCGAIPSTLVESEFFGHERGAYTDAKESHAGKFEQASKGTLFLDEIGELPVAAQAKLLRVLQEREVTRLGGKRPIPVDVRILAATNVDLEAGIRRGTFRQDLYWRLNVLTVDLPPLRDRVEDLPALAEALLRRITASLHRRVDRICPDALSVLARHTWPGNVRELENVLTRAVAFGRDPEIQPHDLPEHLRTAAERPPAGPLADVVGQTTSQLERKLIVRSLAEHGGNRTATAASLGINRKTLFRKIREYAIEADDIDQDVP
jgi:DNA-binding NtrC family response regulator